MPDFGSLVPRYGRARRDSSLAVLEGLHPLKHAIRFGAEVLDVACLDRDRLALLCGELAPDAREQVLALAEQVPADTFTQLAPLPPPTGVIAIAARPAVDAAAALADPRPAPVVLLEDPRDLGNVGACIRVAAAADVQAVFSIGGHDPWHPDALRGSAGLHYALPVARIAEAAGPALDGIAAREGAIAQEEAAGPALDGVAAREGSAGHGRPLLALDPEGEPFDPSALPARAILAFGTERHGLSAELLDRAVARLAIPMRANVSSLNLATSVAAVLFAWRLSGLGSGRQPKPLPQTAG
jgi:RNA methyltransferase, TrmH family